jgi:hypothetical protein
MLHVAEGVGEIADLIGARHRRRGRIVAGGNTHRDARQIVHRARDAAGDDNAGQYRDDRTKEQDHHHLTLQAAERLEGGIQRVLQHGDDARFRLGRQLQHTGNRRVAVDRIAVGVGFGKPVGRHVGTQTSAIGGRERARLKLPAVVGAPAEKTYIEPGQPLQLDGQGIVDPQPDDRPSDRHRGQHRHDDQLVELAAQHDHRRCLLQDFRLVEQARQHKRLAGAAVYGVAEDSLVESDDHHQWRIDALAVIEEHRADGLAIAGGDHLSERVVGCHQARALDQSLRILLEQAIEHARAGGDFGADRAARRIASDHIDQHVAAELHDKDQQQEKRQDARLQVAHRQRA